MAFSKTDDQLAAAQLMMKNGGGFARHIGTAFIVADSHNAQRLLNAFPDLFQKYEAWVQVDRDMANKSACMEVLS